MPKDSRPIEERFWEKVQKSTPDECWPWTIAKDKDGYGLFTIGSRTDNSRRSRRAHRIAYELFYKVNPGVMCVLHTCDNPPRCNPSHLTLGTPAENNRQRQDRGRGADRRGEKAGTAILSEEQVKDIKRKLKDGESQTKLGKEYGVTSGNIHMISAGRNWKHVD